MAKRLQALAMILAVLLPSFQPARAGAALPIEVEGIEAPSDDTARMTVAVHVNGAGPFPFVIDTGADRTVISAELARTLDLPAGPRATLHDSAGISRVETVTIDALGFGAREVRNIRAATLAGKGLGAAGILGIDALHDQRVIIDFVNERIQLQPSEEEPDPDPGAITVRAKRRFGQLVLVDASAAGVKINVILDTGAQNSIGNAALRRLLVRQSYMAKPVPTSIISVTGRVVPAEFVQIEKITIANLAVRNMPIAFADLHTFRQFGLARKPAMLLGMDVLRQFNRISVDFPRKKVRLLPASRH